MAEEEEEEEEEEQKALPKADSKGPYQYVSTPKATIAPANP